MITRLIIGTVFIATIASCNDNSRAQQGKTAATPKALEDKSAVYDVAYSRSSDDLVESLYSEVVSKDKDLKKLEDQIGELNNSRFDSTASFDKYHVKNQSYFSAADEHLSKINDSLLRERIKGLIAGNKASYDVLVAKHTDLVKDIEAKQISISDLHQALKVIKTLPLIAAYQKANLPHKEPLEHFIRQQDRTLKLANTLAAK